MLFALADDKALRSEHRVQLRIVVIHEPGRRGLRVNGVARRKPEAELLACRGAGPEVENDPVRLKLITADRLVVDQLAK